MDFILRLVHIFIVVFCVIGWLHPDTRIYNLILVILIALSWFGLGIYQGLGYCIVTDIQWKVKQKLGQKPATKSFIKYELDNLTGRNVSEAHTNLFTQIGFYLSAVASVYSNYLY